MSNVYGTDWACVIGLKSNNRITNNPFFCFFRRRSLFRRAYKNDMKTTENSTEMVDRHVYANPSYAGHFEIGGMPFYLPQNDAKMSEQGKSFCN